MRRAIAPLVLIALSVAGCGTGDDRRQARAAAEGLYAAAQDGQGEAACARLTPATVEALEREEGRPCAEAVTEVELTGGSAEHVRVFETGAQAEFDTGNSAFLDRTDDGWRVSAAGCVLQGQAPAICELED
jgi:hypothetical protein